jgi:hypothetical protein
MRVSRLSAQLEALERCDRGGGHRPGERAGLGVRRELLLGQTHTAAVTAVQPSSFRVVDHPQAFFEAEPQVAIYIAQILARRLNAVNHLLADARRRIAQTEEPAGPVMDALRRMGHAAASRTDVSEAACRVDKGLTPIYADDR